MSNLKTLNDALFRELERVEACETPEEIESECNRAKAVGKLADNIISNARVAIDAANLGMGVAESIQVRNMLLEAPEESDEA